LATHSHDLMPLGVEVDLALERADSCVASHRIEHWLHMNSDDSNSTITKSQYGNRVST
jgi:hypothetical protein